MRDVSSSLISQKIYTRVCIYVAVYIFGLVLSRHKENMGHVKKPRAISDRWAKRIYFDISNIFMGMKQETQRTQLYI